MIAGAISEGGLGMHRLIRNATWLVLLVLLVLPMTSRGDTVPDAGVLDDSTPDFTHLDPGPSAALWHRNDLSPAERAYVDRAGTPTGRDAVAAAYTAAVAEHIPTDEAQAASAQLGIDSLDQEGVVP